MAKSTHENNFDVKNVKVERTGTFQKLVHFKDQINNLVGPILSGNNIGHPISFDAQETIKQFLPRLVNEARKKTHEQFFLIDRIPFAEEKTIVRCIVIGLKADGKIFIGSSRNVPGYGADAHTKIRHEFENTLEINNYLEKLKSEKMILPSNTPGSPKKRTPILSLSEKRYEINRGLDLANKAEEAIRKASLITEDLYNTILSKPHVFFEKHIQEKVLASA